MFKEPLDYAKQKDYVDSMINPFMPGLYEQCLPIADGVKIGSKHSFT